jgi:uncharacterized repeat protein (TIGR04042 family)
MPEIRFQVKWPDGSQETCYSPSLVVKDYFAPGETYALDDFVDRARTALTIASDRVQAKYGFPCSLALGQLRSIETQAARFATQPTAHVSFLQFLE